MNMLYNLYTPYAFFFTVHFQNFDKKKACTLKRYTVKKFYFQKIDKKKAKSKKKGVKNKAWGV